MLRRSVSLTDAQWASEAAAATVVNLKPLPEEPIAMSISSFRFRLPNDRLKAVRM